MVLALNLITPNIRNGLVLGRAFVGQERILKETSNTVVPGARLEFQQTDFPVLRMDAAIMLHELLALRWRCKHFKAKRASLQWFHSHLSTR